MTVVALEKEHKMSTVITEMYIRAFDRLASSTQAEIRLAQQEAIRMKAPEVYPEYLFLGVLVQADDRVAKVMDLMDFDIRAMRAQAAEVFGLQSNMEAGDSDLPLSRESLLCIEWALAFALQMHSSLILPEHLLLGVLRHPSIQPLLVLLSPLEDVLPPSFWFAIGPAYTIYIDQLIQSRVREQSTVSFKKSFPRRILRRSERPVITFADIRGFDAAKRDLQEVVDFLNKSQVVQSSERSYFCGVLVVGPPCTDRTLLVQATAGEAVVPLISLSFSALVEMLAGIDSGDVFIEDLELPEDEYNVLKHNEPSRRGRKMISHVFGQARKTSPCILLIDNLDAVERLATEQERKQWLNQLVVEMDGLGNPPPVAVIATTSRVDVLDPALLNPGRLDRQIAISSGFITQPAAQTKQCLSCNNEALSNWKYCIYCGASLAQVCSNCGTLLVQVEGARYCFECGTQWNSIKSA